MLITIAKSIDYPLSLERDYSKAVIRRVMLVMEAVRSYQKEMTDLLDGGTAAQVDVLMDLMKIRIQGISSLESAVRGFADKAERFVSRQVDEPLSMLVIAQSRQDDEGSAALKEVWVSQNLDYIKALDDETLKRVKAALQNAIMETQGHARLTADLLKQIEAITGFARGRAALIACDQMGKLNGCLMEYRQRSAGIDRYMWRSSHDSRVRPLHVQHDGQIYSWDKPPSDGHPGMPIRCRCVAKPVLDVEAAFGLPKGWQVVKQEAKPLASKIKLGDDFERELTQEQQEEVANLIEAAPKLYQDIWAKYGRETKIGDAHYKDTSHFSASGNVIRIDIGKSINPPSYKTKWNTLFHETGHSIAYNMVEERYRWLGDASETYVFGLSTTLDDVLAAEGRDYLKALKRKLEAKTGTKWRIADVRREVQKEINGHFKWKLVGDDAVFVTSKEEQCEWADVSDIWGGITAGAIRGHIGHEKSYWNRHNPSVEAFAEMFAAVFTSPKSMERIKYYFPKSFAFFERILEEALKK